MNTGIGKSKASGIALMGKVLVGVMVVWMASPEAMAKTADEQLKQFISDVCLGNITQPPGVVWDTATLATMCANASVVIAGGAGTISTNLPTLNAGGASSRNKKNARMTAEELNEKSAASASADGAGWGLLVAPQYGSGNRQDTDLENGYQSDLKGLVLGLDYRFSDSLVIGTSVGQTKDNATFLNGAGYLKSRTDSLVLYSTWLSQEKISVDGYIGYAKLSLDNQRHAVFGGNSGTINGSTNGKQVMAGMSTSYQINMAEFDLSPFLNLDYIKTRIDGYNETGNSTLELHYKDRSVTSFSSSLGARMSTTYSYKWGGLIPSVRLSAVHEFQNKAQRIQNELVSAPGVGFQVSTDTPDRNYLNIGLGMSAALNSGAQLFLDYEKRTQDKLLSSWAVSLGGLFEF